MELDPQLISVGPGSRTGRNKTLSRRAERHSSEAVESLAPKQINSELQNYILRAPSIPGLAGELHPICNCQGHLFIPMCYPEPF